MNDKNKTDRDLIVVFAKFYLFIRRYYIILLLFIIAGLFYGWFKNHTAGYYFRNHIVVNSIVVEKEISTNIIASMQTLISDNNTQTIAEKLNIPPNAAASLIKIDTGSFHLKENVGFYIDFSVSDSAFSDTITDGLIYYLNNNDYYRKNMQLFVDQKKKLLDALNSKNKQAIDSTRSGSADGELRPVRISTADQVRLLDEIYRLQKDIEFGSKISVVDQSLTKEFSGMGLKKSLILYGIGLGLLGLILSLLIESLRLTIKYLREQKK